MQKMIRRALRLNGYLVVAAMFLLPPISLAQAPEKSDATITPALRLAIKKFAAGATLLEKGEIDAKSCAPLKKSPTFVEGDFNGDQRLDYAVLIKTRETGKTGTWQGESFKEARFAFIIFVDTAKGELKPAFVRRFNNDIPLAAYIAIEPPGKIRNRDMNRDVVLSNPGVLFAFCEKSASVYHFSTGRIRATPVVD